MLGLSFGEILFIGILALIVIGPKQLPEVARNVARFINDLKRSTESFTQEIRDQARVDLNLKEELKKHSEEISNNLKITDERGNFKTVVASKVDPSVAQQQTQVPQPSNSFAENRSENKVELDSKSPKENSQLSFDFKKDQQS